MKMKNKWTYKKHKILLRNYEIRILGYNKLYSIIILYEKVIIYLKNKMK